MRANLGGGSLRSCLKAGAGGELKSGDPHHTALASSSEASKLKLAFRSNMEEHAVALRSPLANADADAESSRVENVEDLRFRPNARVVADRDGREPRPELAAIPQAGAPTLARLAILCHRQILRSENVHKKRRRGRPPVDSERVFTRLPRVDLNGIAAFAKAEPDQPARSEAIRRIIRDWLINHGYAPVEPEPAEGTNGQ